MTTLFSQFKSSEGISLNFDSSLRLQGISILDYPEEAAGKRVTVFADVKATKLDGNELNQHVAIAAFVLGKTFNEELDLLFSPSEDVALSCKGPEATLQIQYIDQ